MPRERSGYIKEEEIIKYSNTDVVRIEINEDKLRLILMSFRDAIVQKKEWISVGGAVIALLLSLVTATFNDTFGISPNVWKAIFIVALILYISWFCISVYKRLQDRKKDVLEETIRTIRGE